MSTVPGPFLSSLGVSPQTVVSNAAFDGPQPEHQETFQKTETRTATQASAIPIKIQVRIVSQLRTR
jgi:hypothetical protein